ncbi:putative dehydrogenase [Peribacillus deserti]|uniref:Dehydrogenase n=1 Tax=Peribacillus deserti TaxID=673318 RepID=A0ABS2QEZ1_9BACI|nr:Gfo/Idh/MocA family oxidoreductase [Peribacillus deserti]MBM7691662.1 putative dehydrogenase [Peribacillus deserti]
MGNKVKVGLIGTGNIGRIHIENLQKYPEDCDIVAVTNTTLSKAESCAAEFNIPFVEKSADELIARTDIDAVIIAVPNQFHTPLTIQALKAGKHVLLEKPMALNQEDAKEILMVKEATDKIVMMAQQMRFEWAAQHVREQIERGELGNIYMAKTGWCRRKGIPAWGTWFTDSKKSGGGPLIDIGVHMLDLALYMMGNPKPVSVFGSTYSEFGPKQKGIGSWGSPDWDGIYDVEDIATAMIKMEDGATLLLEASWAAHMDCDEEPHLSLYGSEGGVVLKAVDERFVGGKFLTEQFDRVVDIEFNEPEGFIHGRTLLVKHFIDCIKEGKEPIASAMDGYKTQIILDAIYESARTGTVISLGW